MLKFTVRINDGLWEMEMSTNISHLADHLFVPRLWLVKIIATLHPPVLQEGIDQIYYSAIYSTHASKMFYL